MNAPGCARRQRRAARLALGALRGAPPAAAAQRMAELRQVLPLLLEPSAPWAPCAPAALAPHPTLSLIQVLALDSRLPVTAGRGGAGDSRGRRGCSVRLKGSGAPALQTCLMPGSLRRARLHLLLAAVWRLGTRLPAESGRPGGRRYVAAQARAATPVTLPILHGVTGGVQTGLRAGNPIGFIDLTTTLTQLQRRRWTSWRMRRRRGGCWARPARRRTCRPTTTPPSGCGPRAPCPGPNQNRVSAPSDLPLYYNPCSGCGPGRPAAAGGRRAALTGCEDLAERTLGRDARVALHLSHVGVADSPDYGAPAWGMGASGRRSCCQQRSAAALAWLVACL